MNYELEIENLKKRIEILESLVLAKTNTPVVNNTESSNRDKTKYMFEGKVYPKNRLVLAIITKYVKDNNPTYEQLCSCFDKSLQGSLNVVETVENANKISDAKKRYFMDNALLLKDGICVVVCTQWGIFNIIKFIKLAQTLGFDIQTI